VLSRDVSSQKSTLRHWADSRLITPLSWLRGGVPEWEHPVVRMLRCTVTEQADELDRVRHENGLLRRWAGQRLNGGETPRSGA
jgi:hypothetical protein